MKHNLSGVFSKLFILNSNMQASWCSYQQLCEHLCIHSKNRCSTIPEPLFASSSFNKRRKDSNSDSFRENLARKEILALLNGTIHLRHVSKKFTYVCKHFFCSRLTLKSKKRNQVLPARWTSELSWKTCVSIQLPVWPVL